MKRPSQGIKNKLFNLIMKTQKITGVDTAYFVKGGFWLFFANLVTSLLSIGLLVVFTNFMDPRIFGEWRLFLTIVGFVSILSLPGMCTAIVQSVSKKFSSSYLEGMKTRIRWSLLGSLGLVLVGIYFFYFQKDSSWIPYILAAVFFPLLYSLDSVMYFITGKKDFKLLSKYKTIINIIIYVGMIILLIITRSLIYVVVAYLALTVIAYLYFNRKVLKKYSKELKGKKDKGLNLYGFNLTVMQGLQIIATNIDKLVIAKLLGLVPLALYAIVSTVAENIKSQTKILEVLTLPKFSSLNPLEAYNKVKQKTVFIVLGSLGLFAIGYFLMPYAIPLLFSEKYASTIPYAQLTLLTILTIPLIHILTSFLQALKSIKLLYWFRILSNLVQIALFLVFIPLWGILGAVWSIIIAQALSVICLFILSQAALKSLKTAN